MGMSGLQYSYVPVNYFVLTLSGLSGKTKFLFQTTGSHFFLYVLLVGLFVLLLAIFLAIRLIITRKLLISKEQLLDIVDSQKKALELKNKNLTDSLVYAQRIQEALLPSESYFRKHFKDSFIFFKPKDIVSGDFYWMGEKGDKVIVVAADCTGHGVPGALLSMIGMEIIGKAISEDNIKSPSQILAILNKALEKTFTSEKNIGTIIRDGMDIGICQIDKVHKKMVFAGAFFPLYLIRENSLTEIKSDKISIGLNPEELSYTDHELDIMEDDIFYIFSDGYVDQFGGSENKKFMYRRFRFLLTKIHSFSVEDQKSILEEEFREWMGSNVQLDDIMVIGFRPLGNNS
jgi:serine phosphatase RsbU (regulator of sigma subunit)